MGRKSCKSIVTLMENGVNSKPDPLENGRLEGETQGMGTESIHLNIVAKVVQYAPLLFQSRIGIINSVCHFF